MSFSDRRRKAVDGLLEDVQALLVTTPSNVRYLTGFTGSNGQLLLTADAVFFTDGRYQEQSSKQVSDLVREIYSGTTKFSDLLAKALADRGVTKLGVEAANMTLQSAEKMRSDLSGIELVPTTEIVEKVRMRKDESEMGAIRAAQHLAEQALVGALKDWSGGLEADLALDIERRVRESGGEGMSFETIVASDGHAALPHASPRREPVNTNGVLLIDMGAIVGGYCSDMTRTYLGPQAPGEMRTVHDIVVAALEAGCAAVRPGAKCSDVDAASRKVITDAGYGEQFIHSTGHGVGLEIHEGPSLTVSSDQVLEAGMIVTIEPGVYLPGVGGVRVEDLLVVTDDGAENLTALPRGPEIPR